MRIQIIGASGAGKSTLSAALARMLGLPLLSGDGYLWQDSDFTCRRPDGDIRAMLRADLAKYPHFVFDGQTDGFAPGIDLGRSALVLLLLPEPVRMERLRAREQARFGSRIAPGGDLRQSSQEFLAWAAGYPADRSAGTSLGWHITLYNGFAGLKCVLSGTLPTEAQLRHILRLLNAEPV